MHENIRKKIGYWESFDDINGLGHECGCLLEDREGNIWIGTSSGLSRYDGKGFVIFTDKDGLPENNVNCIHQDRDGNIWIGTSNGLSKYNGKGFLNFTDKDGLASNDIHCIYQDRDGNIWVGTWQGGLSRYDGKQFLNFTDRDGLAGNYIHCIHQDEDGNIWIGTHLGLSRYDGKQFLNFTDRDGLPGNYIPCIHQDREGNIWIGALGGGVSCYGFDTASPTQPKDESEFVNFNTEYGLAHNDVFDIIQDREGSLWFACYHGGISRYNPYEISSISDESVREVMMQDRDGNLCWGFRNILSQFDGKNIVHYPFEHEIFDLFEDSKGQFWIGTDGGGIFRYSNIKDICSLKPQNLTADDGLANNRVIRIYEDIQGNIWIGTRHGLSKYAGKEFINFTTDDGLGSDTVSVICQDSSGNLWFAGWAGGGITRYDGKDFHRYTKDDGLVDDRIICLIEDVDKNNLWIGTPAGVSYYDGKSFRHYTPEDGLLGGFAQRMLQDSRGQVWIATLGGGISRFDGSNFQSLTTEDGLPSNCVTGVIEDADGNIFISTYRGICKYVPDYKTQPLIRIDEVDADRIYKKPEGIQISESMSSIKIKYHGISFKTQRMRYSYILEGYDEDWKATWDEEVRYESLPIGEYTFKVIAINRDSVYSKKPVELRLTVVADKRDKVISELEEKVRERTEELKEAKDYIDNVIKLMADTLIVINQDGIIKTVNQATLNLLGYEESELIGNPIDMILTAEYEEKLLEESELDDLIERDLVINFEEGFIRNVGNTYLSKGGREIPVLFSGSIIQDDNGEMQGIVCVAQDITGRKQMEEELRKHSDHLEELVQERTEELTKTVEQFQNEIAERQRIEEALRESEKKYRFLYEESPVISFIIGTDGIIKDVNRALLKEFDYSKDEIIGKHAIDFVVPEQREKVSTLLENDFKGEYTPETDIGIYAKDGSIHTVLFSPGQALLYEGNVPTSILVTGIDITERKQAEELARLQQLQLIQAEKMATLGVLSSGVAHEINNPNNFILLNAKIFQRVWNDVMPILEAYYEEHGDFAMAGMPYTQAHEKIGQLISGMSEGSQRIAKIVMGLKDFARQDTGELNQSVDINSVIEVAMLIVGNLVKKSTNRFSCEYGSNLTKIFGNVQQLEQVIINLITNACQAINDKEKGLSISNSYDSNSNNVIVKVCDEGTGMPPECMKYIMDPFFTTKRSSGGTGLGLSISYNIVKAHGGDLKFTSEFGKGTKVVLTLPVHQEVRK